MPAYDIAFDFRATIGYVSDPSYATYCVGESYPTTRTINGYSITFGWETGVGSIIPVDGNSALDPRIAGINFKQNTGTASVFRVDLPGSGAVTVGMSLGDTRNNPCTSCVVVSDTISSLISFTAIQTGNTVADATNTIWTVTQWPANNISANVSFGTTICRVSIGGTNIPGTFSGLNHLRFTGNTSSSLRNLPLLGAG